MCGITGWASLSSDHASSSETDEATIRGMCARIAHRGPDSEGRYIARGVALGIRRLAVIDLVTGEQPFFNEDRSVVAVMNGEIYNFRELRSDLEKQGHRFISRADTEVLPHLYEEMGARMVEKLNGMFAFALWDSLRKRLFIARDRFGQKPLYYGVFGGKLIFGSELKTLLAHPNVERNLNLEALRQYLAFDYVPAPHSIYKGIFKLPAGHSLTLENGEIRIERYWNLNFHKRTPVPSIEEAAEELRALLSDSTRMRLVSDVPVGVLLSGGVDSSCIAAFAQQHSARPIKTFCIGFDETSYDESGLAKIVAQSIGSEHYEDRLSVERAASILPEIATWLDEPLSDASMLPTFLLSRFVRSEVTVALGGDGADEIFGGYPSYYAAKLGERYQKLPHFLRRGFLESIVKRLPVGSSEMTFDFLAKRFVKSAHIHDPVARHFSFFGSFTLNEQEDLLTEAVRSENHADIYADARRWSELCKFDTQTESDNLIERMQFLDMKLYLAEDILTKVDRASMAVSLEVRSPFLDPRIVEFSASLPRDYKLKCDTVKFASGKTGKYILKKAVGPMLPQFVTHRMKRGFVVPTASWLRGKLNPLIRELLAPERIINQGLFNSFYVQKLLAEHETGKINHSKKLWTLLVFQLWMENWGADQEMALSNQIPAIKIAA